MMLTFLDLPYVFATLLLVIGLYGIVAKKNLIKIIVGVMVIEYAANLFLLLLGYRAGGIAPILTPGVPERTFVEQTVDPVPQALILTSIVIGLGVLALMVSIAIRLYEKYRTFDMTEINKLRG
jgi:multicomponent Na+:H+ antiporter subunit C